ncbi:MAG: hypothetical protein JST64_08745 [Actinobacteria bacterium]|nr:hypothetical protein [Actinomycetota bacterium]
MRRDPDSVPSGPPLLVDRPLALPPGEGSQIVDVEVAKGSGSDAERTSTPRDGDGADE